jgi:hypothetical protein
MSTVDGNDICGILGAIPGSSKEEKDIIIQDLKDCADSYTSLVMEFRFVARNGDRIISVWNIKTGGARVVSVNGIRNQVLVEKYAKLFSDHHGSPGIPYFLKHLNEMSPEEYAWCSSLDED